MTVKEPSPAPNPPTAAAPIILDPKSEARRAYHEWRTAIALLQQRWPAAFPEAPQQVRLLIAGLTPLIAAAVDWSRPYHPRCASHLEAAPRLLPRRPRLSRPL